MSDQPENEKPVQKIVIMKNGSYHVMGEIPFVHKTQVVSENGEPLAWKKDGELPSTNLPGRDFYGVCRCGQSHKKPYCDGTHKESGFDGSETAQTGAAPEQIFEYPHGTHIVVRKDSSLCMQSGFCGFSDVGMMQLVARSGDAKMRALIMAMVERCPSGSLTYRIEKDEADIEPDLPFQVAATTEITSEGPIDGPIWVTGGVPIERSDGRTFTTRNRVTLCNCGASCNKPLCDGTHRDIQEKQLRDAKK